MLGGLARKDQRAAGRAVSAGADAGRAAQVDAADGRAAGGGSPAAAAVHHRPRPGIPAVRRRSRGGCVPSGRPEALGGRRHGFPKDGHGVAVRGPAVLRHAGQGRPTARSRSACTRSPTRRPAPLDWRLFVPEAGMTPRWTIRPPRARGTGVSGLPSRMRSRTGRSGGWPWTCSTSTGPGWGCWQSPPVVVADAGYGENADFRDGLDDRGMATSSRSSRTRPAPTRTTPQPAAAGLGGQRPHAAAPLPQQARQRGRARARPRGGQARGDLAARHAGPMPGNPGAAMTQPLPGGPGCRPASRRIPPRRRRQSCPSAGCWPNGPPEPTSPPTTGCPTCPPTPRSPNWSAWPRSAGASSTTTANSRHGLGLDHFEGRSWTGWHRHVTLAAPAHAFLTRSGPTQKPLRRDDPLPGPARAADRARPHPRRLPPVLPAR